MSVPNEPAPFVTDQVLTVVGDQPRNVYPGRTKVFASRVVVAPETTCVLVATGAPV